MDVGTRAETKIPQIVLLDEKGKAHRGAQGSYSWGKAAVDYAKPSSRTDFPESFEVRGDAPIAFEVRGRHRPNKFYVTVFSGDSIVLNRSVDKKMKFKIPRGRYLVAVSAGWTGKDTSNIFDIKVL